MSVTGKVCVVTGASSGIGRRTAGDLAADGAIVCAVARREDRLRGLLDEISAAGADHTYYVADVSNRDQVRALAGFVRDTYGRCDVLVNNAGINVERAFAGPANVADVESVMATNFYGAVYCTGEFLPLLGASAPSHVVNVASMAGRIAAGSPGYCASKFALVGWSEALYYELHQKGVYVSSVEPGFIPTEGFPQTDLVSDPILKHALGTTEDVSAAIRDAIATRKPQRVVPRWYYLLQFPRLVTPPLYRRVIDRMVTPRRRDRSAT